MKAFHDNPELKEQVLKNLRVHYELDQFAQGQYWDKNKLKGCAVGCTIVDFGVSPSNRMEYERLFGIPVALAKIEDWLFESMDFKDAKEWPIKFIASIPVGVDLSSVMIPYLVYVLSDKDFGCRQFASEQGKKAIDTVVELYERRIAGDDPSHKVWTDAIYAAVADFEAEVYGYSVASVAAYAAYVAVYAADYAAGNDDDVRKKFSKQYSEKLIEIISQTTGEE